VEYSEAFKKTALFQPIIEQLLAKKQHDPEATYRDTEERAWICLELFKLQALYEHQISKEPRNCLRIEVGAAEEAQVDFGSAGMMLDPDTDTLRRVHGL